MISRLYYGTDQANIRLFTRLRDKTAQLEFCYVVTEAIKQFDNDPPFEKLEYFFPDILYSGESLVGWYPTELQAREALLAAIVYAFDNWYAWDTWQHEGS